MSELLPVSVHILTRNAEKTLSFALQSVKQCREILLIDGGSGDATRDMGKAFGARIVDQPPEALREGFLVDFAAARNAGLQEAKEPWIFVLDSDEIASPELMRDIARVVREDKPAAYTVERRYVLPDGRVVTRASTYPNERLYFFHRDVVKRWIKPVHERIQLREGATVERLRGWSLAPVPAIAEFKRKSLQYLRIEAEASRGKSMGWWLRHRVLHTLRSRTVALVRLGGIWFFPGNGPRLPLRYEILRFWYGWKLILETCPLKQGR